jgi:hypothetical protein
VGVVNKRVCECVFVCVRVHGCVQCVRCVCDYNTVCVHV